jgi:hypothetical protein
LTILLNKYNLFSIFNVENFDQLESSFDTIPPSITEYYLSSLDSIATLNNYLNKSNIQKSLFIDSYSLYLDYNDNIYLEIIKKDDNKETLSLL